MAHYAATRYNYSASGASGQAGDDDDDDEEYSSSSSAAAAAAAAAAATAAPAATLTNPKTTHVSIDIRDKQLYDDRPQQQQQQHQTASTIHVQLNEGYFARERRILLNFAANVRQKCSSIQMFNPAKNTAMREQQQQWDEKEKYTLDSLNEFRSPLDDKFQWTCPDDGRQVWSSKLQYFLAITSYSIGLGNVIRFPMLVQRNGGLAFIIPFVIMLVIEGIPLFYLELAIGQRMRKAAISCWQLVSPFAAGIGLASAVVSFIVGLYYNTMVAWTLLYLYGASSRVKTTRLPFAECPALPQTTAHLTAQVPAIAAPSNETECQIAGPFQHYWFRQVLDASEDASSWTHFNWPVTLGLILAWLISYLCLVRGLSSSRRVVYVASTFPYVILTAFFCKVLQLPGTQVGIAYLFEPDWSKLFEPYTWLQAAAQVFFSLGLGFGGLIALSSYNKVNNNCYKDAIKVSLINFGTSIYAGIVIFAILGYKAHLANEACLRERTQMRQFYMADYKLKVLDYGRVFEAAIADKEAHGDAGGAQELRRREQNVSLDALEGSSSDYYDSSDAIDSIMSLDRQLDQASDPSGGGGGGGGSDFVGDADTEFIVDASALISNEDYDKIADAIPGLPECSIRKRLDDAAQGTGLVFVVITEAISQFESSPQTWMLLFFLMLLTLGLDSQFGNLEGLLSSISDLNIASAHRQLVTGVICVSSLLLSIVMFAHGAGLYMFAIFDEYAGSFSLVLIALFELLAISYLYGLKRFCDDCELMTGKRPPMLIMLSWRYLSPILLLVVIAGTVREFNTSITYEAWTRAGILVDKTWPNWCIVLGALLILACVVWIPLVAVLRAMRLRILPEEPDAKRWFPAEELREFHDIQEEHKITKLERVLFGFRSDDD